MEQAVHTTRRKRRAALVSVASNSALIVTKLVVGLLSGSVAVISEAVHSAVDLVAALIALFAVKSAGHPADERHQFGHGKIENLSGTIEAILIFAAAGWILYGAVTKLANREPLENPSWGLVVMGVSALVNILVSRMLFRVGRETESVALQADAWHLRTDVWTSFGVFAALAVIVVTRLVAPGVDVSWLDPVAAIVVSLLILRAAYQLTVSSGRDLLDACLPPDEEVWIRTYLSRLCPVVRGYADLRTRKAGPTRFIVLNLLLDPELSVEESHRITDFVTAGIEEHFPGSVVSIHVEPYEAPEQAEG